MHALAKMQESLAQDDAVAATSRRVRGGGSASRVGAARRGPRTSANVLNKRVAVPANSRALHIQIFRA